MEQLILGRRRVDLALGLVDLDGVETPLTSRECALLAYLARRAGRSVHRDELLVRVWGAEADSLSRAVDLAVGRLRKKIEDAPRAPRHLLTVHGTGYRLLVRPAQPARSGDAFLGREDELVELEERIDGAASAGGGLITLVGPGGVGKTRLATEWSRRTEHPCRTVPLASARTVDEALAEVASVLQAVPAHARDQEASIRLIGDALEAQELVLILDNCEQIPELARPVAAWAERSVVLATSRHPLGLATEHELRVHRLSAEIGAELYRARVQEHRAGHPAGTPSDIAALIAAVEGLPLAIELAASRCQVAGPAQMVRRLERHFALSAPGRAPGDRHG